MSLPEISVVIPSWNGVRILEEHLPTVLEAAGGAGPAEVIVCDDGSTDGTADFLRRRFPTVRVAERERNGGFAPTANDGVASARAPVVVLFNNDIAVPAGTLASLVAPLVAEAEIFAAVPSIIRHGSGVDEARTRIRFRRGVVSTTAGGTAGAAPAYACGGAMAFRRDEFLALGGFDPLFAPFYWEDVDLSYRARKQGRRITLARGASVLHDHGRTISPAFPREHVLRLYERNRLLFTWKNLTDPPLWRRHLLLLPFKVVWDILAYPAFARGARDAFSLRGTLRERRAAGRSAETVRDRFLLESV